MDQGEDMDVDGDDEDAKGDDEDAKGDDMDAEGLTNILGKQKAQMVAWSS
ncbi:hypothetical protein PAXRUDRAFT_17990 [Paxillus rubicundulus Ve08.2h10]|uniref:Unplaced genomic scaffold scaffold_2502, whole genome shotgun sequence n=1 Tax=Paxillus rubicundulus Ve08.2h10 TaxID=930991 RepID=A0A0D0CZJ7_9AGAM|nr:hypothetical protein PAXRUDRAFT_17990 [Paxillus rubicundulus Ve08.2h10]